jgi:hypothetical protein
MKKSMNSKRFINENSKLRYEKCLKDVMIIMKSQVKYINTFDIQKIIQEIKELSQSSQSSHESLKLSRESSDSLESLKSPPEVQKSILQCCL